MSMPNSDRAEMNDIIDHLNAVLDEDEAAAQKGYGLAWEVEATDRHHVRVVPAEDADGTGALIAMAVGDEAEHIARRSPARALREVEALQQVINDYRMSDRACMRSDDPSSPEYATIRAGRDAFASVLRAYATATGWERSA